MYLKYNFTYIALNIQNSTEFVMLSESVVVPILVTFVMQYLRENKIELIFRV